MTGPTKVMQPLDAENHPIVRAMGLPLLQDGLTLVDASNFVDVFDLTAAVYKTRAFTGLSVRNPSGATTIELSFGIAFANTRMMNVGQTQYFTLDNLMFGPGIFDDTTGNLTSKIRARLGTAQGTPATGTITYSGVGNPADGQSVNINGTIYEFSTDASLNSGNVRVDVAATKDLTYTALVAAINANDQAVRASVNTGTHVVTITSVFGGAAANAIAIADGSSPTGATFSGALLTGAAGGLVPVFHLW